MTTSRLRPPPRWALLIGLSAAICVTALTLFETAWRIDDWYYDSLLSRTSRPADDRILIVAIDDKSLSALGRWPWPRRIHADLLNGLQAAGTRGIALDILFSEPDLIDPASDRALADAIRNHGKVVLPVWAEPSEPNGPPIETLPLPDLLDAARAMGHVAVDVDPDGVARHAYLRAGLGEPHWPSLALALYQLDHPAQPIPGRRNPEAANGSPYVWNRDYQVRIPYVVDGAGFRQVSFIDLLRGEVPASLLTGRWLLVGVTAFGTGDTVQSPLQINSGRIPGIEYQANLLNMLVREDAIVQLPISRQLPVSIALVLLPTLLLIRPGLLSRRSWSTVPAVAALSLLLSALLLYYARHWFPPFATLLTLLAEFVVLAVYRLRKSQSLAHSDALTRLANRHLFDLMLKRELNAARRTVRPLSLLLIDVDHFKRYNDTYGHQAGDEMLRKVASAIATQSKRPRDLSARYGGDELAVLLPETSAAIAIAIADDIMSAVRDLRIAHTGSNVAPVITVSIGVACVIPSTDDHGQHLLEQADAALYRAKQLGRDRAEYEAPGTR